MSQPRDEETPDERPQEKDEISEGKLPQQPDSATEPVVDSGADKGLAESDPPGGPEVEPGPGGYAGRDPKTDMPRIPSIPETQDDPKSHDAAPPEKGKEREATE